MEDFEDSEGRMISRFQLARPAVELSLLDQMILMPPVAVVKLDIFPNAMRSSSSLRKFSAMPCFEVSNSFLS